MDAGEFREVGHRVVDLLAEYLENIEDEAGVSGYEPAGTRPVFR